MIQHILVGLDGSEYSDTALQHGVYLAQRMHATLHGIHVVDIVQVESPLLHDLSGAIGAAPQFNLTAYMRQNLELYGQQLLAQFRRACDAAHVQGLEYLVTGVVWAEILRLAAGVDLILLGRGGLHTRLSKALHGSTVATVIRQGAKPTMVTPLHYTPLRKPLLAIDGSASAMAALDAAATFVKALALPLQVVHCTTKAEQGEAYLAGAETQLRARGVSCQVGLCHGNVHADLVQYMYEHDHDVLFMGAYGRRRVAEWVLGSTTQYLLHTCPGSLVLCHSSG
jgi:nucleotide-binding universal stress UspA family protein